MVPKLLRYYRCPSCREVHWEDQKPLYTDHLTSTSEVAFGHQPEECPMLVSCSWCHHVNDLLHGVQCENCGHRADRPRSECDCEACHPALVKGRPQRRRGDRRPV